MWTRIPFEDRTPRRVSTTSTPASGNGRSSHNPAAERTPTAALVPDANTAAISRANGALTGPTTNTPRCNRRNHPTRTRCATACRVKPASRSWSLVITPH